MILILFAAKCGFAAARQNENIYDLPLSEILNIRITTATMTSREMPDAPSVISVVTANEIKNMGARNIVDVLRTLPGFDFDIKGFRFPQHEILIRGTKNNNKVKFMINGYTLKVSDSEVDNLLDRIPIDSIRQIEIIRGPGSALYGAGAFAGVINIKTKKAEEGVSEISVAGGSYNTQKAIAQYSFCKEDFKFYGYADYYDSEGYDGLVEEDYAPFDTPLSELSGSIAPDRLTSEEEYFSLQTNIVYRNFFLHGLLNRIKSNVPVGAAKALTDENKLKNTYVYGEVGYQYPVNRKLNILFKTSYSYSDRKLFFEMFPEETSELINNIVELYTPMVNGGGFPEGDSPIDSANHKSSDLSSGCRVDYDLTPWVEIVAGISYSHEKQFDVKRYANFNETLNTLIIDDVAYLPAGPMQLPEFFHTGITDISDEGNWSKDADRDILAFYLQYSFNFKRLLGLEEKVDGFSFIAGFRYDDYSDIGNSINPRAALIYAPTKKMHFKLLFGTAFRAPSFAELYYRNNPVFNGNENLKPEKTNSLEFLFGYHLSKNIRSNITLFNLKSRNLIQAGIDSETGGLIYKNIGKTETCGMETEIKITCDKLKYAYVNATYLFVENTTRQTMLSGGGQSYTQKRFNPGNIANFYGNIGINYDIAPYMIFNFSINYVGEKERCEEKIWSDEMLVKQDLRDPVGERILLNASLTFRNFMEKLEIQISGFNILDDDHRDPEPEGKIPNDYPMPGISFMAEARYVY